jgi:hypothetical protein
MKFIFRWIGFALGVVSLNVLAGPAEIDLIGLRMGQSEVADVARLGTKRFPPDEEFWNLEIGGHKMPCSVKFIDGKLSRILCFTGDSSGTRNTAASNLQVHEELKAGYLKKFGKPDLDESQEVQNRMGAKFLQNKVRWNDAIGNFLSLENMSSRVTAGIVLFVSEAHQRRVQEEQAKKDAEKKF